MGDHGFGLRPPAELARLDGAELAGLDGAELAGLLAAAPAGAGGRQGGGAGFAEGGVLDGLAPGVSLAGFAEGAHARLARLTDDELIGVLRAWARQESWAQARKLAAVAELARRRPADRTPPASQGEFPASLSEFTADEVALALTLTRRSAGRSWTWRWPLPPGRPSRLRWRQVTSTYSGFGSSSTASLAFRRNMRPRWRPRCCRTRPA